nr:Chain F, Peptide from Nuclear receptor coactivator 2 [Homo sapiens]5Z12_I Chain I, Peptide from Nuclear receptor coactivator 2 [Homo sapiens]8C1L_D Chain D, Nuclear receptor coactivator 2 [Homo sapiens]8C1L_E Chain E, Nuclear receptor coactivator 2 [Homo sapiens]
HKILHRLLQ